MNESKHARRRDELIAELLDSRVPKTEREHAAAREIEKLRSERDAQKEGAIREHLIRLGWTPPDEHALSQPAEGEDIMVNTPYDVFILPLQPSGLSSGPRFVVHVPGPKARGMVDGCHCATCTCNPGMTPAIRFDTSPAAQEGAVRDPDTIRELLAERDALLDALRQIAEWPDGGNRYGQWNIKRFAQDVIDARADLLRGQEGGQQ